MESLLGKNLFVDLMIFGCNKLHPESTTMSSSPGKFPKYVDTTQQLLPKSRSPPHLAIHTNQLSIGQRQTTGRTKAAFKYSHPIGFLHGVSHAALKHTGKSGLTPVSATKRPITPSRRQKEYQKDKIRYYQTRRYYGFTADDLYRLEALAHLDDEAIVENTLRSPIHPLFARNHWETQTQMPKHVGPAPIRGDADVDWDPNRGYWLASSIESVGRGHRADRMLLVGRESISMEDHGTCHNTGIVNPIYSTNLPMVNIPYGVLLYHVALLLC